MTEEIATRCLEASGYIFFLIWDLDLDLPPVSGFREFVRPVLEKHLIVDKGSCAIGLLLEDKQPVYFACSCKGLGVVIVELNRERVDLKGLPAAQLGGVVVGSVFVSSAVAGGEHGFDVVAEVCVSEFVVEGVVGECEPCLVAGFDGVEELVVVGGVDLEFLDGEFGWSGNYSAGGGWCWHGCGCRG